MNHKDFYKNKKILITGADGFIGSHLIKKLISSEADITALVLSENLKNLNSIKNKIKFVYEDITKKEIIDEIIKINPECIFHFAALTKTDNYPNIREILETNIMSTINIAEAAIRLKKLKRLIFSSTYLVYEDSAELLKEDNNLNPKSSYAISKYTSGKILQKYSAKHKLPLIITRLFNVYGENNINNVIFLFAKSSLKNKEIYIDGDGKQLRDFIYIDDVIEALLLITQNDKKPNTVINVGSGEYIKIKELAEKIKNLTKSSSKIIYRDFDPGLKNSYCNNSLLKSYGWKQKTSMDKGLKKTIEWIKENEDII